MIFFILFIRFLYSKFGPYAFGFCSVPSPNAVRLISLLNERMLNSGYRDCESVALRTGSPARTRVGLVGF